MSDSIVEDESKLILRSGAVVNKIIATKKSANKSSTKQFAAVTSHMADQKDLKDLLLDMKLSLSKEINDFRMDFKVFRDETVKDIKIMMAQMTELRVDQEKTSGRLEQVEHRVGELHDTEILHHESIKYLVDKVSALEERTDYLENKSRQNSVRIFNIEEKSEGDNMTAFLKKLFNEVLNIPGDFNIVRALRVYREGSDHARPIIATFLDFETKKNILHGAWRKKELIYKGKRIFIDHDFSPRVKQQRAQYRPIRDQLKARNIKSHILAPAKLKVFNEDGSSQIYGNAQSAAKELLERGLLSTAPELQEPAHPGAHSGRQQRWERSKRQGANRSVHDLVQEAEKNLVQRE